MTKPKKRIMFVDDVEENALIAKENLENLGYQVTAVANAKDAFQIFRDSPDKFDLIITDQVMPGMMGDDLAKAVHKVKASVPVILVTGYSTKITVNNFREFGFSDLVMKPWLIEEMKQSISQVLAARP